MKERKSIRLKFPNYSFVTLFKAMENSLSQKTILLDCLVKIFRR